MTDLVYYVDTKGSVSVVGEVYHRPVVGPEVSLIRGVTHFTKYITLDVIKEMSYSKVYQQKQITRIT